MENVVSKVTEFTRSTIESIYSKHTPCGFSTEVFKALLCILPLLNIHSHRPFRNLGPLILTAVRGFMTYIIFGLHRLVSLSNAIYFLWSLSDFICILHLAIGSRKSGILKYKIGRIIFIMHATLEVISVFTTFQAVSFACKYILIIFLCFHLISVKMILLRDKNNQMQWFAKNIGKKRD